MNKNNLITLGAFAQRKYGMGEHFEIIEFPSDAPQTVRVVVPMSFTNGGYYSEFVDVGFEEVTFEKVGTKTETIWIGYSKRANTLVIKESTW